MTRYWKHPRPPGRHQWHHPPDPPTTNLASPFPPLTAEWRCWVGRSSRDWLRRVTVLLDSTGCSLKTLLLPPPPFSSHLLPRSPGSGGVSLRVCLAPLPPPRLPSCPYWSAKCFSDRPTSLPARRGLSSGSAERGSFTLSIITLLFILFYFSAQVLIVCELCVWLKQLLLVDVKIQYRQKYQTYLLLRIKKKKFCHCDRRFLPF